MIRLAREGDIPRILEIYGPYIINTTASFEYTVPTQAEFTQRFRRITEKYPWLVWEENGQVQGYAYGSAPFERAAYQWSAEVSIYLTPEAQGKGIGRKLYAALEKLLQFQGFAVVYAIITSENLGSRSFHARMGYSAVAELPGCGFKFGRELGIIWMEKRLFTGEIPSEEPKWWNGIVKNDRNFFDNLDNLTLS